MGMVVLYISVFSEAHSGLDCIHQLELSCRVHLMLRRESGRRITLFGANAEHVKTRPCVEKDDGGGSEVPIVERPWVLACFSNFNATGITPTNHHSRHRSTPLHIFVLYFGPHRAFLAIYCLFFLILFLLWKLPILRWGPAWAGTKRSVQQLSPNWNSCRRRYTWFRTSC